MAKIGFFVGEFTFPVERYIIEEIEALDSSGVQPFIFSDKKFPLKKYSYTELEPSVSVWQSLKSLNGLVEGSHFFRALKRSAHTFDNESVFSMATKASTIIKSKKVEILNAYSPLSYSIAMVSSWITKIPFGVSILSPDFLKRAPGIETVLKEAEFIIVYSDRIIKNLENIGCFDRDKILRIFPGLNPYTFSKPKDLKICVVGEGINVIEKISRILPERKIVQIKEDYFFDGKERVAKLSEEKDVLKVIGSLELIVFSLDFSFDDMFSLENRLLRKALYYGIPFIILGKIKEGDNIGKLLKNFIKTEEQFEGFLKRFIDEEKTKEEMISNGKEIAKALFDLRRNTTLIKGLLERVMVEKTEINSIDKWLKRGRKLPQKK
ncbi:MAG: hypothetical protein ACUVUG_00530 [Candidatus Aminicenantia bacterium]